MADEKNGSGQFEEFDARLRRLRDADAARRPAPPEEPTPTLNWGSGLQVGIELLAGLIGGVLLGYGLDRWLGTRPLFMIVFFFLGAAAGMMNAWRSLRRMQAGKKF
jgi:F0F1-type ATP synthase assembly protein I